MSNGTARQPRWDKYEAAILLDGYLETIRANTPKHRIVKRVSKELRQMAQNRGIVIDEVYRNENGISYQIQSMESAYVGRKLYVPATKLFVEMVELYKNDNPQYQEILKEARHMIEPASSHKDAFLAWASSQVMPRRLKWIETNLQKIESFGSSAGILHTSIFETVDLAVLDNLFRSVKKNKIFKLRTGKLYPQVLDDFILYLNYCLKVQNEGESPNNTEPTPEHDHPTPQSESESKQSGGSCDNIHETLDYPINSLLREKFQYGYKYESIREMMRFRQFAEEKNISLPEDDEELKGIIISSGIVIDDKVYCKNEDLPGGLRGIVDKAFSSGAQIIYYECLYRIESEWMETQRITSAEMLKQYLQQHLIEYTYSKKFMAKGLKKTEKEAVSTEILRVWSDHQTESVDSLNDRLPYIPLENIWRVISGNDLFVLVTEGVYLRVDRLIISNDEAEDILDYVETACVENGFCSLSDVPLGDIEEENYELSRLAILNAIYKVVLSRRYHLNGKILTKDESELDAVLLLKQHVIGKDSCTFDEVSEKVIELTGAANRQYAFQALYDSMVRIDKTHFVADNLVNFNIQEIDSILSTFIPHHFCAVREIATFAMFPVCGQSWNHYLLESYCYRFSQKYSFYALHFNDKNAGIIAEKGFGKEFNEMLAIALARTDLELNLENAGRYLFDTGYMAKSKYAKLGDIVESAKYLREGD